MGKGGPPDREALRRQAERDLDRVASEGDVLGGINRSISRAEDHFSGADADPDDRVELWGRRIGRALSLVFLVGLILWLANAYL
jgi:hypothetical protein